MPWWKELEKELCYEKIDIRKGINLAKSSNSKKIMTFNYWSFNYRFKFQDSACNGCDDLTMLIVSLAILLTWQLEMLTIVLLFITSNEATNLWKKVMCLKILDIYKKHLKFQST